MLKQNWANTAKLFQKTVALSGLLVLAACGSNESFQSSLASDSVPSQNDRDASYDDAVGGQILNLSMQQGQAVVSLSDFGDSDDIVLAVVSYKISGNQSFELNAKTSGTSFLKHSDSIDESENFEVNADDEDLTENFHDWLRGEELQIDDEAQLPTQSGRYLRLAQTVGETRSFKVLNSFKNNSSYVTVSAELRYQTEYFNFYVDTRDAESVTDLDLEELALDFADVIPLENDLFGNESDVDSNGRFNVLFTRTVNQLGAAQGGVITGFFYGLDLFESSKYPASNEMEVIYTFVPDPQGKHGTSMSKSFALQNVIKGVLPHEYQHMISFNEHYFQRGGLAEESWLNEGLSHFAEDLSGMNIDGDIANPGKENPSRVSVYLTSPTVNCFTCGSNLSQRGGSYLFVKYLYEQAQKGNLQNVPDGFALINNLVQTSARGQRNILDTVLGPGRPSSAIQELLNNFYLAIYLDGTGYTTDNRYEFDGINLRGMAYDDRGTVLNGPAVHKVKSFPYAQTLQSQTVDYVQISKELLIENGGSIELKTSSNAELTLFLVR